LAGTTCFYISPFPNENEGFFGFQDLFLVANDDGPTNNALSGAKEDVEKTMNPEHVFDDRELTKLSYAKKWIGWGLPWPCMAPMPFSRPRKSTESNALRLTPEVCRLI